MAKVDVLLPYWGDVDLFIKAVDSVLAQTETDWQLLIFDDHYPSDKAAEYVSSLHDSRVKYHRHASNIGITSNFNYALGQARADYFVMLGCDDKLLPNYLETALQHIGDAEFYQPGVDIIDEEDSLYLPLGDKMKRILQPRKSGIYYGEKLAASLCRGNWLYFPSILWKTKTVQRYGFDTSFKIVEDLVLVLCIIKDGGKVYFDKHTTFQYRRSARSLSSREKSKGGVRFTEEAAVYQHFATVFTSMGWKKAARSANLHLTSRLHRLLS